MRKLKPLILLASLFISANVFAATCTPAFVLKPTLIPANGTAPQTGASSPTEYPTPTYWKQCWSSVDIHTFSGAALQDWTDLKIQYQQKYHAALLAQMIEASEQKMAALKGGYESLLQTTNENFAALQEAESQIKVEMMEKELDYTRKVKEAAMNEKNHGFFNDGNGEGGIVRTDTQSYQYFKSVCKRNKMFKKTSGSVYKEKRNADINKEITKKSKEMNEVTGSTNQIATAIVKNHSSEYCSAFEIKYNQCVNPDLKLCEEDDIYSGVCTVSENEMSQKTNLDTDAVNFLTPNGFDGRYSYDGVELEKPANRIEDELFNVSYTYDPEEEQAARDYASLLIYQAGLKAPATNDKADISSPEYISEYNRYLAKLNLANVSFQNAIASRVPITEGEIKMSERDVLRYIIHNLKDPDTNSATSGSKEKGSDLMIYQLMTINNKLKTEQLGYKERIKILISAILASEANAPALIEELNALKE